MSSKLKRIFTRSSHVIPSPAPGINFARNLLSYQWKADSSAYGLGMTFL